MNCPDANALLTPVRLLGVIGLPRRPEFPQQSGQLGLGLPEGDPFPAIVPLPKGAKDEQGLVRGTLVAPLPDAQVVEAIDYMVGEHRLSEPGETPFWRDMRPL